MKDITYGLFFSLCCKIFHFLLNFLGVLLICCPSSKPEFLNEADPLPKASSSLQLIPNPVKPREDHEWRSDMPPAPCRHCFPEAKGATPHQQDNSTQRLALTGVSKLALSLNTHNSQYLNHVEHVFCISIGSLLIMYQTVSPVLKTVPG